ncbi:MAG: SH3 domain-containing protein, partial [Chloroflexota bacterium]
QDSLPVASSQTCAVALEPLWTAASSACINQPSGYVCNGGAAPAAEPAGLVGNALASVGALVELSAVDAIRTPPISTESNSLGVAWMRLPDPLNVTVLLIGAVTMFDVTPPDFPPWTSSIVQTDPAPPNCAAAPRNVVVIQSQAQAALAVNSTSVRFNGTILIATDDDQTIFIGLSGVGTITAAGGVQELLPGEQVNVPHAAGNVASASAPPNAPAPLNSAYLNSLPVPLFDRPLILPQAGYASTLGATNLRVAPDIYSGVITQVPGGQPLTVLGGSPDSSWFHIRLSDGQTGWMLAELLSSNIPSLSAVYSETPLPPQRLGELGTRARVVAPVGVNLRRGPDVAFLPIGLVADGTLVDLLARSPYLNGWIKVSAGGTVGWLSLLTLDTQAFIDALPIDYSAPPMPTPTTIPGSFGNAFPDLDTGG